MIEDEVEVDEVFNHDVLLRVGCPQCLGLAISGGDDQQRSVSLSASSAGTISLRGSLLSTVPCEIRTTRLYVSSFFRWQKAVEIAA